MKITVFTSNQPRHLALISRLSKISEVTYAVMECNTIFPGQVLDFYKKSDVMKTYFSHVINAENNLYGNISFSQPNVRSLSIKSGDLSLLDKLQLGEALESDVFIVFGASYIRGWLSDFLIDKGALNIHMGLSPYYRGSSCNFWALYDGNPQYVGATIHLLSKGLDSGPILIHAIPNSQKFHTPFDFTMHAVEAAQLALLKHISSNEFNGLRPVPQDKSFEIRYTKNKDFTDDIASQFLIDINSLDIAKTIAASKKPLLLNPFFA